MEVKTATKVKTCPNCNGEKAVAHRCTCGTKLITQKMKTVSSKSSEMTKKNGVSYVNTFVKNMLKEQ